ncbi:hypothetical protein B0J13DRAFT_44483 [Dactylonectria estremocensis]|uniref:Uncharacterized protein n=1 Tax=Dactylonectria estremocensis TaxID=1079267 RepID=A0A9P9ETZ8_9HYPO|nr:hypothetical protein B0J13DRAFT_44483 [Dactylonectria estremocensis]
MPTRKLMVAMLPVWCVSPSYRTRILTRRRLLEGPFVPPCICRPAQLGQTSHAAYGHELSRRAHFRSSPCVP